MEIDFEELAAVCCKNEDAQCDILQEATWPEQDEGVFVDYDHDYFNCCEKHCPLNENRLKEMIQNQEERKN